MENSYFYNEIHAAIKCAANQMDVLLNAEIITETQQKHESTWE